MTPEIYRAASDLLEQALTSAPDNPAAWLESASAIPGAREEALRLLHLHQMAEQGDFLEPQISQARSTWLGKNLAQGTLLANRFRIDSLIGEGGMGQVYAAFDQQLSQRVALKTLHSHLARDPISLERFRREVLLLRDVQHPSVIRIFDFISDEQHCFFTMDLLEGQTLADRLAQSGPLPADAISRIASDLIEALAAIHARGIVHRDLKPANIFETTSGRIILMDFGIATTPDLPTLTATESVLGSLDYMSPEQLEGREVTPASDYYAFGLLAYELSTGGQPWVGTSPVARAVQRLQQRRRPASLPGPLGRMIDACLEPTPADRPSSPAAIRALLSGKSRPLSRRAIRNGLYAVAALIVIFLAIRFWPRQPEVSPEVTRHLKLASQFSVRRNASDLFKARDEFQAALNLAPNNTTAWIGLADVYSSIANFGFGEARPTAALAEQAADRAIELDPRSGPALAAKAYIVSLDYARWRTVGPLFERAITLDPQNITTRLWYGAWLGKIGRFREALTQLRAGLDIDPGSMVLHHEVVAIQVNARDWKTAEKSARYLVTLQPREPSSHLALCRVLLGAAKYEDAETACREALRLESSASGQAIFATVLAARGDLAASRALANDIVTKTRNVSILCELYSRLGEPDRAIELIEEAYRKGDSSLIALGFNPRFDLVRSHPRVRAIASKLGFE